MKKLLVLVTSIALALPAVTNAGSPPPLPRGPNHGQSGWHGGDHDDNHGGWHQGDGDRHEYGEHRYDGDHRSYGYTGYYPGYRYYPTNRYYTHSPAPYYYYGGGHHNNHGGDHDDALWAIGGLIVGAVVGTAVAQSKQKAATSVPSGPPAGCRDVIVYDSKGEPRVQRDCN
ncbi:MAG TPA: hypothetical protein VF277_02290 [Steroidobacteraceae bacterium]